MNNSNFEEDFNKVIAKAVYQLQETIKWLYGTSLSCKYAVNNKVQFRNMFMIKYLLFDA